MKRLQAAAHGISRGGAIFGGALLLVASFLICIDITTRYLFAWTLGGADELSGYALAISSAWGFSWALLHRGHIRIDTVYVRIGTRLRAALDLISLAVSAFFFGLVTWYAWGVVWQSFQSNSHSLSEIEAPLVIPQGLWFLGLLFFVLVTLLLIARAVMMLLAGDLPALFALIGSKSAVDEAHEEVLNVEHAFQQERKP